LTSAATGTNSAAGDFGIKAENGEITVGGTLTCNGKAAYSVWAGTSVTVEKDVTITNAAEGSVGMYANGFLNFVSGKWDVTAATAALQAGNGIVIPEGFGVTLPGRGFVAVVDSLNTVTESDGTTVAAHAIIEAKEYTEGYYLIGPDWTLTGIVPTDKFEVNPDNANEYILKTTLAVGDKIKVVKLTDGAITEWYPDGVGNEYTVDQAHAGTVNIYFKTTYDSAWSEFGGFFYIEHVHDWGKPTWTWSEDLSSATATFVCAGDPSHTVTLDAVVTVERSSDCEWGTFVDYTATVEFEGKTYKGSKSLEYPNGHPWGEPTWEWAEDYSSATATFVCENDASHTKTVNATITSETNGRETVYTATVELDGLTYIDTKTVVSAAVTVTFDAGEGTVEPATKEVNPGEAIGELPVPTREGGWKFIGWFTAPAESYLTAGQGTQVTAETTVDEDTTVYAHWRLPGDINGDGKVNNKDVTRLQKYLKGEAVEVVAFNLDTNGDGNVSNKDLTRLQRFVKGETVELN
jgi:ribosomal protein L27